MIRGILRRACAFSVRKIAVVTTALVVLVAAPVALASWMAINTNDGQVAENLGSALYTSNCSNANLANYLEIKNAWAVSDGNGFYYRLEACGTPAMGSETMSLRIGAGLDCNNDGDISDPYVSGPDGDRKVVYWPNADQVWIYSGTNQQIAQLPDNSYGERVGAVYDWWVPLANLPPACRASAATVGLALATARLVGGVPQTQDTSPLVPWNHRIDYGDANNPDPQAQTCTLYPSRIGCNGARHGMGSALVLGAIVDADGGNGHGPDADVDDLTALDDEDGVSPTPGVAWMSGGQGSLTVTVTGGSGYLNCWVDWNADQDWADANEKILADSPVAAGTGAKTFTVPVSAANKSFIARCRLSPGQNQATAVTGATEFGEVEDHKWSFNASSLPIGPSAPSAATGLVAAVSGANDVNLTWSNPAPNDSARVLGHQTNPYFTSTDNPFLVDASDSAAPWAYLHTGIRGAPASTVYYIVYGQLGTTQAATPSNRVGLFEFSLTPGS